MKNIRYLMPLALLTFVSAAVAEEGWTEDFEAAKKLAKEENKDLLVNFSGSDWCGWCVRLEKEVFSQKAFISKASMSYVLVTLDFPRRTKQPAKIKKQNEAIQQKYGVRGFPTVLLMDSDENLYARTGYQKGGAEKYLSHLKELQKNKEMLKEMLEKIEKAEGIEKAGAMDKLVKFKQMSGLPVDTQIYRKIVELDPDGKAGLKARYQSKAIYYQTLESVQTLMKNNKVTDSLKAIDEAVSSGNTEKAETQQLLYLKAQVYLSQNDLENGVKALEKAQKTDPRSQLGRQLLGFIRQVKAQLRKKK